MSISFDIMPHDVVSVYSLWMPTPGGGVCQNKEHMVKHKRSVPLPSASYWVCFSTCPRPGRGKKRQHSLPICHRSSKLLSLMGESIEEACKAQENVKLKKCNFFLLGPQFLGGAAENGHNGLWEPLVTPEVGAWGLSGRWRVQLNGHPQWGRIPAPAPQGHQASEEGSGPARGSRTLQSSNQRRRTLTGRLLPAAGKGSSHGSMPQARLKLQKHSQGTLGMVDTTCRGCR